MESAVETLLSVARAQPERALLITPGGSYGYGGFARRAATLAGELVSGGLPRGARVALLLDAYDDFFIALFAVWLAGGVAVPLNTTLPAGDLEWLMAKSGPEVVLTPPGVDLPALTEPGAGGAPRRPRVVAGGAPRRLEVVAGDLPEAPLEALDALTPVAPDDLAMVMFTSGTTGRPKGVCQRLRAISANAGLVADRLALTADDRIFINTPPYFTSGICHFLTLLAHGGGTAGRSGFFFGSGLLDEIAEAGCSGFGGAPAHLVRVVEPLDEPRPAGAPRFWVSSGDHLPLDVIDRARRVLPGLLLFNMYGLTEVSGRLCVLAPDEFDRRRGSVGRPLGEMKVTPRAADGAPLPDGEVGELYVAGPLVMQEYLGDPEVTAASLTPYGFRTGDFGRIDADGFVWVEGRHDDIIKRGGEKVSLVHIQEALRALGLFSDVAVIAADDELLGRVPVAFVVPAEPGAFERAAVMRALRRALPSTSLPSRVVALPEIPRTGSGKPLRPELLRLDRRPS